jgi:hypothetical protein
MAYSGTVGQTVVTVQNLIDNGARRAGKLAEELTVEQVQSAKQSLFFLLSNLINQGIQYFAIKKQVYGLQPNKYEYTLPDGGVDVLNALYRYMTQPIGSYTTSAGGIVQNVADDDVSTYCLQTSANGNIVVNYGTNNPQYIGSIGLMPYIAGGGSATWSYYYQASSDGSTWTTLYTATAVTVTDGQWIWQDIDPGANVLYYRILAFGGTTLGVREWYLGVNSTEITMARLNRDDYTNLPNKNFTANQPFQFWLNRTIPNATITLWPTPQSAFYQMTVWYSSQIEDVGDLYGQLAIPDRWLLAIQSMLAHQMSLELPAVDLARIQYLEAQGEKYFIMAEQEERDKSPIYYSPNISVYTR